MSDDSTYQKLRGHLAYLRLAAAAEALPGELDHAAKAKLGHTAFLERLLDVEVAATEARRHAGLTRFASLPAPWRLTDFDFDAQPSVDRALVNELGTLRFLEDATNVLFIGPPGVGKTMLAVGLAHASVDAGYRTYYTTAADLAARCHRAALEGRWATTMRFFAGPRLLIIDEVGYLPLAAEAAAALFQVITQRYLKSSHRADHEPRHRLVGPDLRRPHRRRRHARPAPAPLRRVQHRRRELPHAHPPRPAEDLRRAVDAHDHQPPVVSRCRHDDLSRLSAPRSPPRGGGFCSDACRAAAYRRRRDDAPQRHRPRRPTPTPITVYECDHLRRTAPRRATLRRLHHLHARDRHRRRMPPPAQNPSPITELLTQEVTNPT